jgi:hypothetical protein
MQGGKSTPLRRLIQLMDRTNFDLRLAIDAAEASPIREAQLARLRRARRQA